MLVVLWIPGPVLMEAMQYVIAMLYWSAFSYMVFYFAGYAKSDRTYYIMASVAIAVIATLLVLDIYSLVC